MSSAAGGFGGKCRTATQAAIDSFPFHLLQRHQREDDRWAVGEHAQNSDHAAPSREPLWGKALVRINFASSKELVYAWEWWNNRRPNRHQINDIVVKT